MLNGNKLQPKVEREPSRLAKWWRKNDYKVWRVVLFPLWIAETIQDKRSPSHYTLADMPKVHRIMNKCLPKVVKYECRDVDTIAILIRGDVWGNYQFDQDALRTCRKVPRRYRRFFTNLNWDVKQHIWDRYSISGYTKTFLDSEEKWRKAEPKFWTHDPKYSKMVIFSKR